MEQCVIAGNGEVLPLEREAILIAYLADDKEIALALADVETHVRLRLVGYFNEGGFNRCQFRVTVQNGQLWYKHNGLRYLIPFALEDEVPSHLENGESFFTCMAFATC